MTFIDTYGLDGFKMKDPHDRVIVTPLYQQYAGWVNTIWYRFTFDDEALPHESIWNWEVSAAYSPMFQPVTQLADAPDKLPSWGATLFDKNGNCLARRALNDRDKRIEALACEGDTSPPTRCVVTTTNSCGGDNPDCTETNSCGPCTTCKELKGIRVPKEVDEEGVEPAAPTQTTAPSDPVVVNTTPVETVDTDTDLPDQGDPPSGGNVPD
jgi:hypothetical protein